MRDILSKHIDVSKTSEYIKSLQHDDGSFQTIAPHPITTMHCLRILNLLGKRPKEKTINWVQSLQTGKRGFGETTGQNSWDYTTFWGSRMHKDFNIKPRFEKEFEEFVLSHQTREGGFSSLGEKEPNFNSTVYWCNSAIDIGFGNKINSNVADYLHKYIENHQVSLKMHYLAQRVASVFDSELPKYNGDIKGISGLYYNVKYRMLLGKDISEYEQDVDGLDISTKNLARLAMIVELKKIFGKKFDNEPIIKYVKSLEMEEGGFVDKKESLVVSMYECIQSLLMLEEEIPKKEQMIEWLQANSDRLIFSSDKETFWSVRSYDILKRVEENREIIRYAESIMKKSPYSLFYSSGICRVLGHSPRTKRQLLMRLMRLCREGGFSSTPDGKREMYETYRAIVSIHNLSQRLNWVQKIPDKWIMSCECPGGGFGWVPGERPYIQPTYQALHSLFLMKEMPKDPKKHIEWIKRFYNTDGGFNGGEKETPSSSLYTYYALASLLMLEDQKVSDYLGL